MENKDIIAQIDKLTQKTKDKKVAWTITSDQLARWIQSEGDKTFVTTLQMQIRPNYSQNRPVASKAYYLTIQSTNPNEILLQINSRNDDDIKNSLAKLYHSVMQISEEEKIKKINKLISGIN